MNTEPTCLPSPTSQQIAEAVAGGSEGYGTGYVWAGGRGAWSLSASGRWCYGAGHSCGSSLEEARAALVKAQEAEGVYARPEGATCGCVEFLRSADYHDGDRAIIPSRSERIDYLWVWTYRASCRLCLCGVPRIPSPVAPSADAEHRRWLVEQAERAQAGHPLSAAPLGGKGNAEARELAAWRKWADNSPIPDKKAVNCPDFWRWFWARPGLDCPDGNPDLPVQPPTPGLRGSETYTPREYKLGEVCKHDRLARQCEVCERDDEIVWLKGRLVTLERKAAAFLGIHYGLAHEIERDFEIRGRNNPPAEQALVTLRKIIDGELK